MIEERPRSFEQWKARYEIELEEDFIEQSVHQTWEQFLKEMYDRYMGYVV